MVKRSIIFVVLLRLLFVPNPDLEYFLSPSYHFVFFPECLSIYIIKCLYFIDKLIQGFLYFSYRINQWQIGRLTTIVFKRMSTSIWSGQLSRHLCLSILFHDHGWKKFKKYFIKQNLKWKVTTQPCPQRNFFKKNLKKTFFRLPPLAKRCAWDEVTTGNQIKNYFFKELFILFVTNQGSHKKSINTLRKGTLVFFKSIYRDSNLKALSSIFKI